MSNADMVNLDFVDFGEPVYTWKAACPSCGLAEPRVEVGQAPRCWRCNHLLGDDEPISMAPAGRDLPPNVPNQTPRQQVTWEEGEREHGGTGP